jgi:hypothetical protein
MIKETIFKILYFLVAGDPEYQSGFIRDYIFGINNANSSVFENTMLLIIPLSAFVPLIYFLLNRTLSLNKLWLWWMLLMITALLSSAVSFYFVGTHLYPSPSEISALGWKFVVHTFVISGVLFYIFSLLFRRFSFNARYIPHKPLKLK